MQLKSTRGVQQEDVWTAADQLIADGLRPTIERVRLKMGRGSPNTVSPLLDGWFATLGRRLGAHSDVITSTDKMPSSVRLSAAKLWETALQEAQIAADEGLMAAQQNVAAAQATLEQRETNLAQRELNFVERQHTMDEMLQVARSQVADLSERLAQSKMLIQRRETELEANQLKLSQRELQIVADQRRTEEQLQRHAQERLKLEEHASITERRLMIDLDRERQETKRLKASLGNSESRAETLAVQFQAQRDTQAQLQLDLEQALHSERQATLVAHQRASELRDLLDEQAKVNGAVMAQLNQLLIPPVPKASTVQNGRRLLQPKPGQPRRV